MTPDQIAAISRKLEKCPTVGSDRIVPDKLVKQIAKALAEFEADKREWVGIGRME